MATNKGQKGGLVKGKSHATGGVKSVIVDTNKPIELEGGEAVINKTTVRSSKLYDFQNQKLTAKEILSKLNIDGGGVPIGSECEGSFEKGGIVENKPKSKKTNGLELLLSSKKQLLHNLESEYNEVVAGVSTQESMFKKNIEKLEFEYFDLLFAKISDNEKMKNLAECAFSMPDELIHSINRLFNEINKSPYSCSVYSAEKTWSSTVANSYSVTDHWNFYSQGKYHKLTTTSIEIEIKNKYPDYNIETGYMNGEYFDTTRFWYLAQFIEGEKGYDDQKNDFAAETKGAWVILDVFKSDAEKADKIRELSKKITNERIKLNNIIPTGLISSINQVKDDVNAINYLIANDYKSFEDFEKKAKSKLKERYEAARLSLLDKLNKSLVTGTVTKKEWSGSGRHFKLVGETTHSGVVTYKTATTITIDNNVSGNDYTIDASALTEDEKNVFYDFAFIDYSITDINRSYMPIKIKLKFKDQWLPKRQ